MRLAKLVISILISLTIMVVIFMLSAQSSGESGSLSDAVARMLAEIFIGGFDQLSPADQASIIASWAWPVRKTAHATEYACLAISWVMTCWQYMLWSRERSGAATPSRALAFRSTVTAFIIAVLYACTDELHQLFIDGRAGQITDVLVDSSGALVGCLLSFATLRAIIRARQKRLES